MRQVRFGVLNAGNFGVSQSRKRTFIYGAAPGETLPEWPKLMHVFRSPQLTINLPGGVQYTAVPQTVGAPLRTVTVRDAIGDLPPIENGAARLEMPYAGANTARISALLSGSRIKTPKPYSAGCHSRLSYHRAEAYNAGLAQSPLRRYRTPQYKGISQTLHGSLF